jgi:hypothetical protein
MRREHLPPSVAGLRLVLPEKDQRNPRAGTCVCATMVPNTQFCNFPASDTLEAWIEFI